MFKCYLIKNKLYSYLDNTLGQKELIFVKKHLNDCPACRSRLGKMENLIKYAKSAQPPELDSGSWHDFKIDLDRKLNARLVPEFKLKRSLSYQLRPVLVYASILVFMFGLWVYKAQVRYTISEDAHLYDTIVDESNLVDELAPEMNLNHDEDAYIDEINLLMQLGGDLA